MAWFSPSCGIRIFDGDLTIPSLALFSDLRQSPIGLNKNLNMASENTMEIIGICASFNTLRV